MAPAHFTAATTFDALCSSVASFASFLYLVPSDQDGFVANWSEAGVGKHIPMTLDHQPVMEIVKAMDELPKPIVTICSRGNRAAMCALYYEIYKNNWSPAQCFDYARDKQVGWITSQEVKEVVLKHMRSLYNPNPIFFRQLFESESSTYTYIIGDSVTKEVALIDSVDLKFKRDSSFIKELGLKLLYSIDTHVHADHITASGPLQDEFKCKIGLAAAADVPCDVALKNGDVIQLGTRSLVVRSTPGHTNSCLSFVMDDLSFVLTGDALLHRSCGRTDFQQGNSSGLYQAIHKQIFTLPNSTLVYYGHDYSGFSNSSVGEEIQFNEEFSNGRSEAEFVASLASWGLPLPRKLHASVPANMRNGRPDPAATSSGN